MPLSPQRCNVYDKINVPLIDLSKNIDEKNFKNNYFLHDYKICKNL
jgi:hypothetical protein